MQPIAVWELKYELATPYCPQANKEVAIMCMLNASFLIKILSGDSQTHIPIYKLKLLVTYLRVFPESFLLIKLPGIED